MKEAKHGDGQIPLSELLPDDPEMAAILEEALAEAFAAGQAEKPEAAPEEEPEAENTVANSACRAEHPETCRVHGLPAGRHGTTPGSGQREGETPSRRDAHGTFDEAKLAADPQANQARARSVVTHLLAKKGGSEPKALYRQDTGWIGIDYGAPGNPKNDYKGGHGLTHILAKHPEAKDTLIDTLQKGEAYKHDLSCSKLYLIHKNSVAVLTKHRTGRLLITDYGELKEKEIERFKAGGRYHVKGEN